MNNDAENFPGRKAGARNQNSRSSREILKMDLTRRQAALLLAEAMVGVPMAAAGARA